MIQPSPAADHAQVLDAMVALTRLSNSHRTIVAGRDSIEYHLALCRRGFLHIATPATCRIAKGQFAVGLIAGGNSLAAIETALAEISRFLAMSAGLAALISARDSGISLKFRAKLEQSGFRIEAGARCQEGFVLAAFRQGLHQLQRAA